HSARGQFFQDVPEFLAAPAATIGSRPHAVASYVVGNESRGFSHSTAGGTASQPLAAYPSRWLAYLQGLIPTLNFPLNNQERTAWQSETGRRGVTIALEEAFYAAAHGVEPWFAQDPAWGDPTTATVLRIDGVPRARTREYLRDKILLD